MNINNFMIRDDKYQQLCQIIFKVLNCHLLWIMRLDKNSGSTYSSALNILVTDLPIFTHYCNKAYYLQDPLISIKLDANNASWQVTLGTHCEAFKENGFLHDLHEKFNIQEFASITKSIKSGIYCFRFFTEANHFVFMNKLINNMPIIKNFINAMVKNIEKDLHKLPSIDVPASPIRN